MPVQIKSEIRWAVFARDGYRCLKCGATSNLSVDHIDPQSNGGSDEMDNLQTLCRKCNSSKGGVRRRPFIVYDPDAADLIQARTLRIRDSVWSAVTQRVEESGKRGLSISVWVERAIEETLKREAQRAARAEARRSA